MWHLFASGKISKICKCIHFWYFNWIQRSKATHTHMCGMEGWIAERGKVKNVTGIMSSSMHAMCHAKEKTFHDELSRDRWESSFFSFCRGIVSTAHVHRRHWRSGDVFSDELGFVVLWWNLDIFRFSEDIQSFKSDLYLSRKDEIQSIHQNSSWLLPQRNAFSIQNKHDTGTIQDRPYCQQTPSGNPQYV